MSVINNDYQTNLLFKQFTGVAATQLDQQFSNEPYRAIKNIFSRDIFIEEVPLEAPISIYNLDNSGAWIDSSGSLPSVNSGNTFSQVYPDSKLEFYKNIELTAVPGSNSRVWYKLDASNNNILQDTINFKFDDINSTYLMRIKYNNGAVYVNNPINSYPLFWVLDNQSGYLQFYSTTAQLAANANIPTNPPKISFFKYVGKKGLLNLDISGQQQVVDISNLDVDVSSIQINLNNLNRMILPDGYVDISGGAPWDLCGNEVVRTYYQYTRNNTFIGYGNLPILDSSAVNHSFDPSHNNILYELDVSGIIYISGHSQLQDVSCNNLDVSGNLTVLGHSQLQDVSCNNLDVSGNLTVLGHSQLHDVSCNNLDVSGNLTVLGHSQLQDVSCNNLDVSGNLTVLGHSQLQDVSCNNLDVSGVLDINCNNIIDVSNIYFCNNTALLGGATGILTISGDLDMSMNQIVTIADATDNSGVPSWGQVQAAIGGGGVWSLVGNDIYNNNSGNVGISITTPSVALDVSGSANISQNTVIAESNTLSTIDVDKNLYVRNTNLVDTLKISSTTFFDMIWQEMLAKDNGVGNKGDPGAVPTFVSVYGPNVIPIAFIPINQHYIPSPQPMNRPFIANSIGYFTIKLSQPPPSVAPHGALVHWDTTQTRNFKSGLGGIPEQTIHFIAGYIDNYLDLAAENRKPKPFIKILSTNIINQKCITGITQNGGLVANIALLTDGGFGPLTQYSPVRPDTPKIGGLVRIIIAEGLPGLPADPRIQNKAWLFVEQTWNDEPWQQGVNQPILKDIISDHIIDVKLYQNSTGELSITRDPTANVENTDWQLLTEKEIQTTYTWDLFVLPMGPLATPAVFPVTTNTTLQQPHTLQVGGTPIPNPPGYPVIEPHANLWEVELNKKDWPYGVTTTEEIFENNVDICGNLIISGSTIAQAITATDITCNNLDALNSIDVGPNQKLTITENNIISTVAATGWAPNFPGVPGTFNPGLEFEAENFYFDCGNGVTRGFVISLGRQYI